MQTPLTLARTLAPRLAGLCWAIGGSTMLQQLQLVEQPHDLDIITSSQDFPALCAQLAAMGHAITPPADPRHATRHAARFEMADGLQVDVLADLALRLDKGVFHWPFDAGAIQQADGLPWCLPEDWALLYRLSGCEEQTEALDEWLGEHGVQHPQRLAANLFAGYPEQLLRPTLPWWPWDE